MDNNSKLTLPGPISDLGHRLEVWRRARPGRGAMPSDLWEDAARLAQIHGINPIARALRLDYHALKRHMQAAQRLEGVSRPAFVEVSLSPPLPASDCVVELERPDGARMRVQLSRHDDLVALTESFWRCRA